MAISRSKKETVVSEVKQLMQDSKLTLIVSYQGVSVKQFQALRKATKGTQVVIRVIKNNLVKKALKDLNFPAIDSQLTGMLVYVFNPSDEVAGAQVIQSFAKKTQLPLNFVGAVTQQGQFMEAATVNQIASLASKNELIGQLIANLQSSLYNLQNNLNQLPTILSHLKVAKN